MKKYILSALLGAVAGVMGGALGTSGAFTILPGLLLLGIVKTQKKAAGTTLITILAPLSILAAVEYYKKGNVDVPVGIVITVAYMLAAWFGAKLANKLDDSTIQTIVGFYLLLVSSYFFYKSYHSKKSNINK
uniref:Membrane transporter protein n=1 Tax=viral metagenome TaxID=1070528 RepID=A0A6C0C5G1_9ZZZZ